MIGPPPLTVSQFRSCLYFDRLPLFSFAAIELLWNW